MPTACQRSALRRDVMDVMRAFETDAMGIKSIVWAEDETEAALTSCDAGLAQGFRINRERITATRRPDLDNHPKACRYRAFAPALLGA